MVQLHYVPGKEKNGSFGSCEHCFGVPALLLLLPLLLPLVVIDCEHGRMFF